MVARELTVRIPESLSDVLDEVADKNAVTAEDLVSDITRRYLLRAEWRELQSALSVKAAAAGIVTEDDVEALVDESNP